MCFKRLFKPKKTADKAPARQAAVKSAAQATQTAMEALSRPMDSRPLREQINDFIDHIEHPRPGEILYRRNFDAPKAGVQYSLPEGGPGNGAPYGPRGEDPGEEELFSLPKARPFDGGQARLPDQWQGAYRAWHSGQAPQQTFREFILDSLERKGIDPVSFYTAADIDRKLFSRMKIETDYRPSKDTAIRCCLALKLDAGQTERALSLAGYSLSWSLREDLAVRWCIQHRVFRVYEVMEVVEELKETVP